MGCIRIDQGYNYQGYPLEGIQTHHCTEGEVGLKSQLAEVTDEEGCMVEECLVGSLVSEVKCGEAYGGLA